MMVLFYFLYLASSTLWSFLLFRKSIPSNLDENFYGFIALIEFLSILFIRTRSSFKFLPLLLNTLFVFFLYYVKFTIYGFFSLALCWVFCSSCAFFSLAMLVFEIPALSWNPSFHYVPSLDKPRLLFFPLFSFSSYYDLPHFWSMFYPLHDRSTFTPAQMSLVDKNFVLMNSSFENTRNNGNFANNGNSANVGNLANNGNSENIGNLANNGNSANLGNLANNGNLQHFNEVNFDFEMQNLLNPQANSSSAGDNDRARGIGQLNQHVVGTISEEENSIQQNLLRGPAPGNNGPAV